MGVVKKVASKVAGKVAEKAVDKVGNVANNAIELKKDEINKDLYIEKEKTKRISLEHDIEMEKIEASNYKEYVVDYAKAASSIDYLCEAIMEIEKERSTYKYKNAKYKNNSANPVNNKIISLISHYQIPNDRDEFLRAAEIIIESEKYSNNVIARSWHKKLESFGEKAKHKYRKDKEIKKVLKGVLKNTEKIRTIIFISIIGIIAIIIAVLLFLPH